MHVGHALAAYTLQSYFDGTVNHPVPGGWQSIIIEAVESTKIAHPHSKLICFLDKKAFGAEPRKLIQNLLDGLGVSCTSKLDDVKYLWKETMK